MFSEPSRGGEGHEKSTKESPTEEIPLQISTLQDGEPGIPTPVNSEENEQCNVPVHRQGFGREAGSAKMRRLRDHFGRQKRKIAPKARPAKPESRKETSTEVGEDGNMTATRRGIDGQASQTPLTESKNKAGLSKRSLPSAANAHPVDSEISASKETSTEVREDGKKAASTRRSIDGRVSKTPQTTAKNTVGLTKRSLPIAANNESGKSGPVVKWKMSGRPSETPPLPQSMVQQNVAIGGIGLLTSVFFLAVSLWAMGIQAGFFLQT